VPGDTRFFLALTMTANCLLLTEADVERLLTMPLAIDAMVGAFAALQDGRAHNVPRVRAQMPGLVLHSMSAAAEYLGLAGWKQYTTTAAGARFHVGVYDASGQLVAFLEANRLGQMRTGAVTGLAARLLARGGAEEVGLFGSGWQAESQLHAIATALPIRRAFVFSRSVERREKFAARMSERLQLPVTAVDDPRVCVENRPIVVTATSSRQSVFDGRWLAAGTLVCAIGSNWLHKAEIDVETIRRAERIVCDEVVACQQEAGDFVAAVHSGVFAWKNALNLGAVVADPSLGRQSEEQIVLFKSVGLAIEDLALAARLLELARAAGIGVPFPL
jgi:alanine dehydrogenase